MLATVCACALVWSRPAPSARAQAAAPQAGTQVAANTEADAAPGLRIEAPDPLGLGAGSVAVLARIPIGPAQPLLLTVRVEGDAVQVVRARFLRADARVMPSGELRFDVPVLSRTPGDALLRVELATYRCARGCRPISVMATRQVRAAAASPGAF